MGDIDTTLTVNLNDLDINLIADLNNILYASDALLGQLGDVAETFLARENLNECAEVHDAGYATLVNNAHLNITGKLFDLGNGTVRALIILPPGPMTLRILSTSM